MSELPPTPPAVLDDAANRRRSRFGIAAIIKWTLFIVVLAYVIASLKHQFVQIEWSTIHFRILPILGAIICLLLVPPVQLISYRTLLGAYAHAPSLRVMAVVAWIPPLGKYVPGKVISLYGAVHILRKFQIPAAVAVSVVLAMDGFAVISGLITGTPLIKLYFPNSTIPAILIIIVGVISLHPAIFGRLLNVALIKTGRQPLDRMPDLKHYIIPVMCAFSQWLLAGTAFWLTVSSVANVSVYQIPRFISIAALGYTIGYLVLFAPAGLGAREQVFQLASRFVSPSPMTAVAVVSMRIIQTFTELFAALVGLIILRRLERDMPAPVNPTTAAHNAL